MSWTTCHSSAVWLCWLLLLSFPLLVPRPRVPNTQETKKPRERKGHSSNSCGDRLLQQFLAWLELEEYGGSLAASRVDAQGPDPGLIAPAGVRLDPVRQRTARRDFAETINIVVKELSGWALATLDDLGKHLAGEGAFSDAPSSFECLSGYGSGVAMAPAGIAPLDRLIRYALRPCELMGLRVCDCMMPGLTGCENVVFVRLQLVKSRTRGARMRSVRLDVQFVVAFMRKCFKVMNPSEHGWCFSTHGSRQQHCSMRMITQAHRCCWAF